MTLPYLQRRWSGTTAVGACEEELKSVESNLQNLVTKSLEEQNTHGGFLREGRKKEDHRGRLPESHDRNRTRKKTGDS
ncbi:unnamed protein product [Danaus chrysippus]|uniref:(African queen) hypothetical protein n=1 Tax=Danaus chrysippus TaxID=151541 RepID=A0A8J2R3R8_9NEOP|nr:unnamed protein product [Danaus chrysippus]